MADTAQVKKRLHKATYARDKRAGGYLVRVEGPQANMFADREVPVLRMDGSENLEKLITVVWSGKDKESGANVALYKFEQQPRELASVEF